MIAIVDYDPRWPTVFSDLATPVHAALGVVCLAIERVGSTAVPGLATKAIIDLDVVVRSRADIPRVTAALARLGYQHKGDGGIPGREAYAAPPGSPPHHLYVVTADAPELRRHLLFRDYLRRHPNEVEAYGALKREIAARVSGDRVAYTDAKTAFVEAALAAAAQEGSAIT